MFPPSDLPYISSGQVSIENLTYVHNDPPTYPKTLKYDLQVDMFKNWDYGEEGNDEEIGPGEIIHFPGYLVMKNEL